MTLSGSENQLLGLGAESSCFNGTLSYIELLALRIEEQLNNERIPLCQWQ